MTEVPSYIQLQKNYSVEDFFEEFDAQQREEICAWLDDIGPAREGDELPFSSFVTAFFVTLDTAFIDYLTPGIDEFGFYDAARTKNPDGSASMQMNTVAIGRS